jgi:hypothetical protein
MSHQKRISARWTMRTGALAAGAIALAGASVPAKAGGGPSLGAARSFAALAGSTVTNTGLTSVVGDVGVSPGTEITGFPPGVVSSGAIHSADMAAAHAHGDAELAYAYLKGMASIPANNRTGTDLGGLTLAPGVYKFDTSAQLTGDLTLDAGGDSGACFVFQIGTALTTASGSHVVVINGGADYDESNVFWQVGSSATLGSGTAFTGNILAYASITLVAGSSMTGNALALVGGVSLDSNVVTSPTPGAAPVAVPGSPQAPNTLSPAPSGLNTDRGTQLSWTDTSVNETGFHVFRRDGASPDFVLVGTVASTDSAGTGAVLTFQDPLLDPSTTYSYRVTAFSAADGESVPSAEARVDVVVLPSSGDPRTTRWVSVQLGRGRSVLSERIRARSDSVLVAGSYSVIVVDNGVPSVMNDADPRVNDFTVQIRAPGNVLYLSVLRNDPRWKASRNGVYTWRTNDGRNAPVSSIRIDTRKSEFTFKSDRADFSSVPAAAITVSLGCQGATGSDTRVWDHPKRLARGTRAVFTLPK